MSVFTGGWARRNLEDIRNAIRTPRARRSPSGAPAKAAVPLSLAVAAVGGDVPRSYPARRCIPSSLPVLPVAGSAIHLMPELDVGFVFDVDRCRVSRQEIAKHEALLARGDRGRVPRQDIARHEALLARITARHAGDPLFELAIAETEGWNIVCRTDIAGAGHDEEPEDAQHRLGDRSGFWV